MNCVVLSLSALFARRILLWLYHLYLPPVFMHLFRIFRSLRRFVWPDRLTGGVWLSLLATLTLLSAPAHGLASWQKNHAVTLCTAQGMMTVWVDSDHSRSTDNFADLKLKANQQCLACLTHVPNAAPPMQAPVLPFVSKQRQAAVEPNFVDIATPHWRWVSPRAPPTF